MSDKDPHRAAIQEEFTRAAPGFSDRTRGRFDAMGVASFSQLPRGGSVLEAGVGTGNFLELFAGHAGFLVGVDLTAAMLAEAVRKPGLSLVQGDARQLPLRSRCVDLAATAQTLHHVQEPLPVLKELRRVARADGRVLIVDQVATESYEQMAFRNELEALRDPTHAASRPPSVMRMLVAAAGLEIVDESLSEDRSLLSRWMWHGEFPEARIEKVRRFIEGFGAETGMDFERDGDDWSFARRRIMLLARRS